MHVLVGSARRFNSVEDIQSLRSTRLADWILYGRKDDSARRTFRRWLNEARGRVPVIG